MIRWWLTTAFRLTHAEAARAADAERLAGAEIAQLAHRH